MTAPTLRTRKEYARRLRLEKAAGRLLAEPLAAVTDVALDCGFSTSALFCRLFRARFGMSPTAWREKGAENSKKRQAPRKNRKEKFPRLDYEISAGAKAFTFDLYIPVKAL